MGLKLMPTSIDDTALAIFPVLMNEDESTAAGIHLDIPQMGYVWKSGGEIKSGVV